MTDNVKRKPLYGVIEGGGTKFVCTVACSPEQHIEWITVPTTDARTALVELVQSFPSAEKRYVPIAAFSAPIALETGVGAAALAQWRLGGCGRGFIGARWEPESAVPRSLVMSASQALCFWPAP